MIEAGLADYLARVNGIRQMILDRIYPELAPDTADYPRLTYQLVSDVPDYTLEEDAGFSVARVQIDCWGKADAQGYKTAKLLAEQVRRAVSGRRGYFGDFFVQEARIENMTDFGELPISGRQLANSRVSIDVMLWHEQSVPSFADQFVGETALPMMDALGGVSGFGDFVGYPIGA